jgi:hypothetical protein
VAGGWAEGRWDECVTAVWESVRCGLSLESDVSDVACLRGGLPAQVPAHQPDQHDRQRGVHRTDGAYSTVRFGAVGLGLSSVFATWLLHAGAFLPGFVEACFLL